MAEDRSYSPEAIQGRQQEAAKASRAKKEAKLEKVEQAQPKPSQPTTKQPYTGASNYLDPKYTLKAVPQKKVDVTAGDWNWQNAKTDANGNPLETRKFLGINIKPIGFDPMGNPYFGPGLEGWGKKWAYKVSEDRATVEKSKESWKVFWETANRFSKNVTDTPDKNATEEDVQARRQEQTSLFLKGAGELWKAANQTAEASGVGVVTTPVLRIVNATVGSTLEAFGAVADVVERGMGAQKAQREYATDAGSFLPALTLDDSADEALDKNTPLYATRADERVGLRSEAADVAFRLFTPALQAYDTIRFWTAPGTLEEKLDVTKLGWTEGQMLYTELYKRGVQQEYQKRVQAGEDPDRLAMELQDPWVEAIGEIILDPLNVIGMGGKASKAALTLSEASEATKASGALIDITDDLQAISKATSNAESAIAMSKIEDKVIAAASRTGRAFDSAQSWKATAPTPDGNRFKQIKGTSNYLNTIVQGYRNNGGSMDDIMDYVTALAKRASGDKELVRQSIATFSHSPFQTLAYNQAAFDTGYMLNQLIGDGEGLVKAIKATDGTWADLTRVLDDKMRKAVDYAFPSVKEMSRASTELDELLKVDPEMVTAARQAKKSVSDIDNQLKLLRKNADDFKKYRVDVKAELSTEARQLKAATAEAREARNKVLKNIENELSDLKSWARAFGASNDGNLQITNLIEDIRSDIAKLKEVKAEIKPQLAGKVQKATETAKNIGEFQAAEMQKITDKINELQKRMLDLRSTKAAITENLAKVKIGDMPAGDFVKKVEGKERLAAAYKKFASDNPGVAKWSKTQAVLESIIRPINGALANSYFSLSYGYAFRNFTQNMFTLFVDDGVLFTKEAAVEFTKNGVKTPRLDQAITDILGAIPESLQGKKTMVKSTTEGSFLENTFNKLNSLGYSPAALTNSAEVYAGKMIYLKKLRQVSNGALKPGVVLPDLTAWTKAGYTEAQLDDFANLMKVTGYNPDKATTAFLRKYGNGTVDQWRMLDWVNPDAKEGLEDYDNFWNDIVEITNRDGSQNEILDALDELKIKARQNALKATDEPVRLSDADPMWKEISNSREQAGKFADKAADNKMMALKNQFDRAAAELNDALNTAAFKLKGDPNAEPIIARIQDFTSNVSRQSLNEVASAEVLARNEWAWEITRGADNTNAASLWDEAILGPRPYAVDKDTLLSAVWDYYRTERQSVWGNYFKHFTDEAMKLANETGHGELFGKASASLAELQQYRNYVYNGDFIYSKVPDIKAAELGTTQNATNIRATANTYGISSGSGSFQEGQGANKDKVILNIINKYAPSETGAYTRLDDVPPYQAEQAFAKHSGHKPKFFAKDGTPKMVEEGLPVHPPYADNTSPASHAFVETKQGVLDAIEHVKSGIKERWGLKSTVNSDMNALSDLLKDLPEKTAIMKATAQNVAEKTRDFALLAYGETTNMDFAMSMIYPYQFWYSRSYKHWMTRAFSTNPEIIGRYANLKEALASEQKELPDWWKSQLNVSRLLGIETDEPTYMNLEATLNPLYGLTGADFNSPDKRVNWWTAALDDIGKFGPSVWAPIQWATAAYLYTKGEKEAASLWGGRMIPQTATLKSISSFWGTPVELDPMVQQFSGEGLFDFKASDPYEQRRIMRALMAMQSEGYSQEELMEVARTQKGEIWDEAYRRAVADRRPGQLSSFFFGVGFKQRTQADIVTDEFYQDYRKLLAQRDFLPPDQFRDAWDTLREKYQKQNLSMDALLLSGKTGVERDTAFAYNVLSRIPPGEMTDMADMLGVKPYMLQQFYDGKGDLTKMTPQDRDRFMAAVLDLSAMLKMPSGATRQEWNSAKETYASMNKELEKTYGEDILQKIDRMYSLPQSDWDMYLEANPEVQEAMRAKDAYITNTPILGAYYGSLDTVERYYTTQVYTQLEKEFGSDIDNVVENYYFLQDNLQEAEAKQFYKANNLKAYFDRRKELLQEIDDDIINAASQIPEGIGYEIRPEFQTQSGYQEEALNYATTDQQAEMAQAIWNELMPAAQALLQESFQTGEPVPASVQRQIKRIAEKYGMSQYEAIRLLGVEQ